MEVDIKFIQCCKSETALRDVLVELTLYHYIQVLLQKLCHVTAKTLISRNLIQNRRVY